jgi:hypothetical protein
MGGEVGGWLRSLPVEMTFSFLSFRALARNPVLFRWRSLLSIEIFHFRFFNEKQKGLYTDFQYEALLIYRHYTGIAISCV